jgi:hypothetical protein
MLKEDVQAPTREVALASDDDTLDLDEDEINVVNAVRR